MMLPVYTAYHITLHYIAVFYSGL